MEKMKLLELVDRAALCGYGLYNAPLAQELCEKDGCEAVVAALNNADLDGVLLRLLESDAQKVFDGMALAAVAVGTDKMILHIPEYAAAFAEKLAPLAAKNGVAVELGIVDMRKSESCLLLHIVTAFELSELVNGSYVPGEYVSVNADELRKLPGETKLSALVSGEVKALRTGYVLRGREALALTLEEAELQNGVLQVLTADDCVVDTVQRRLLDDRKQSCGKCVFCREGLLQLEAMQKDMTVGKGRLDELDMTEEIGEAMNGSCCCSLGQNAARLPLSALKAFPGEYEDHIKKHHCAADVCAAFRKVYVDPTACSGCAKCMAVCPVDCIDGAEGYIHIVFNNDCTQCGRCIPVCPEKAIHLTTERLPKLPDRMLRVGRFH